MKQLVGSFSVLFILSSAMLAPHRVSAADKARPIEVISDPYGVGNPTHYSILRGSTRVTFSHPLLGQFTRAEITVREKSGNRLTRFALSPDGKTYRPTLQLDTPFEKHLSTGESSFCPDPKIKPEFFNKAFTAKVMDSEEIAKTRALLTKAKFFEASCFDPSIPEDHRNAIMNATADVLTKSTQNGIPEPTYLQCLQKYGFAHEAGIIEGLVKQSMTQPKLDPRLRVGCTADDDAPPGEFDEKTKCVKIQLGSKPDRGQYASTILHEFTHPTDLRDGKTLQLIEACCARGEKCEILKLEAEKRKIGERTVAVAQALDQKVNVATSEIAILAGTSNESSTVGPKNALLDKIEMQLLPSSQPEACKTVGPANCKAVTQSSVDRILNSYGACIAKPRSSAENKDQLINHLIFSTSYASQTDGESVNCSNDGTARLGPEIQKANAKSVAELAEKLPQTSPISWEVPKESAVPIRMANNDSDDASTVPTNASRPVNVPTRTIASISPLPDEKPQRRLGSRDNRADVKTGRATVLVDTLESAAKKVSSTLTFEKLETMAVNSNDIFKKGFEPKTKSPQYIVASFVSQPIKVADIGDMKDLGFANPFASVKAKPSNADAVATASRGADATSDKSAKTLNESKAKIAKEDDPNFVSASSVINGSDSPQAKSPQAATAQPAATMRNPTSTHNTSPNFKAMDRHALIGFLTSSYRTVAPEMNNPELWNALTSNNIVVFDADNHKIGSTQKNPDTFVYNPNLSRLVQTRVDRKRK